MHRAACLAVAAIVTACTAPVANDRSHSQSSVSVLAPASISASASAAGPATAPVRPRDPPARIVEILTFRPYVEDKCAPDPTREGAKRCRYRMRDVDAEIVTLSPSPERVARWIVDASRYAEPIDGLFDLDRARWEDALALVARHVKHQSSRIFPLSGEVVEDLGQGARAFAFDRGVVSPCDEGGCACRINSIKPGAVCRFRGAFGLETETACKARLGGPSGIEAWRHACDENHRAALAADFNEHFRAAAFDLGRRVRARCGPACKPADVVASVEKSLRLDRP